MQRSSGRRQPRTDFRDHPARLLPGLGRNLGNLPDGPNCRCGQAITTPPATLRPGQTPCTRTDPPPRTTSCGSCSTPCPRPSPRSPGRRCPGEPTSSPLLVALLAGVLDDHLERIAKIVDAHLDALHAAEELLATSRLRIGQRVRIGHNVRPLYLHGRPATITERHDQTWVVQ